MSPSKQRLSIGIVGPGRVGSSLLHHIQSRGDFLRSNLGADLVVSAVANSRFMDLISDSERFLGWGEQTKKATGETPTDLQGLADHVQRDPSRVPVVVDCTDSQEIAMRYRDWLENGIHVVTPNKKAGSGDLDYYLGLRRLTSQNGVRYLYETTVGAALPILRTLRGLTLAGDQVKRVEGLLSGSLSYILGRYDGSERFSELVLRARELGLTEPDPRDDLSGADVARKTVILGREIGMSVSLDEVNISNPLAVDHRSDLKQSLVALDSSMSERVKTARAKGQVLRLVGEVDLSTGCSVALRNYDSDHPFARVGATDNIIKIESASNDMSPLLIQGSGAGSDVTAAGLLTELLSLAEVG